MTSEPASRVDELLAAAMAAADPERSRILALLARADTPGPWAMRAYHALAAAAPGKRLALEFVAQMPEPIPPALILLAAQALQERANPVPLRLSVAGKLLASVSDQSATVGPIVRSVTTGLSRSRALERMIQLQSRVDQCRTLDAMVKAAETRLRLKCPKCGVKLHRVALIKHLWKKHRLEYQRGVVRETQKIVERAVDAAARTPQAEATARAYTLTQHFFPGARLEQVLQAVASRQQLQGWPIPDSLARRARDESAGLCSHCLSSIPDPIPSLPAPLSLASGRLVGEGYRITVVDSTAGRTITMTDPDDGERRITSGPSRYHPRGFGVAMACWVFLPTFAVILLLPEKYLAPPLLAILGSQLLWAVYGLARLARRPLPERDDVAVDTAWTELAAPSYRRSEARTFLLRLCLTSLSRGEVQLRAGLLKSLDDRLLDRGQPDARDWQLLAGVRVLRACDAAKLAKDRLKALVTILDPFFAGEMPPVYVETAAAILEMSGELTSADRRRYALLVLAAIYDSGLPPRDLIRLLRFLPALKAVLGQPTADDLRLAYVMWRARNAEPWAGLGSARTLMELAQTSPNLSRRILSSHPDALLKIELPDVADRELGDVLLTASGLIIGGHTIADPDVLIEMTRSPRGSGWMLALGSYKVNLDRKLTPEVTRQLAGWLRYRVQKLLPQAEQIEHTRPDKLARLLKPLSTSCPVCSTRQVCRTGKIGEPWPLTNGS